MAKTTLQNVLQTMICVILGLLAFYGRQVSDNQRIMTERLRCLELNQAAMMQQLNIRPFSKDTGKLLDYAVWKMPSKQPKQPKQSKPVTFSEKTFDFSPERFMIFSGYAR